MSKFKIGDRVDWFTAPGVKSVMWANVKVTALKPATHVGAALEVETDNGVRGLIAESEAKLVAPAKVRTLKKSFLAAYQMLASGEPVAADALDTAVFKAIKAANPSRVPSTDACAARIRDLRKPIYGGHNIVYNHKAKTYQLILPQAA